MNSHSIMKRQYRKVINYLDGIGRLTEWFLNINRKKILFPANSTFFGDGLATRHYTGFMNETLFKESFRSAGESIQSDKDYKRLAWRAHIATWAANQGIALGGDFVDCGVWHGILSRTICNYVDFKNYKGQYYLIDSWGKMEGSHPNYPDDIYEAVKERFSDCHNVHLIRGLVPEALSQVPSKHISYLAIDMNGSIAERAALEHFYDKMLPGGVIYFDDYGWNYPDLRKTVDEFFADKPETLLHFPSGNSIVVKQ